MIPCGFTAAGGSVQGILESGIEWIVWIQQFQTPATFRFWEIYTNFGGSYYLYLVPALLWCVDYRAGLRTLAIFTAAVVVNTALKEWFAQPRPFQLDERIISDGEMGYGLPSGHAQLAVVFWGSIASWVGRTWFWWLAAGIAFLMGVSRIVLGVHFPSDVVAGWALGALMLWLYLRYQSGLEAWLARYPLGGQVGWAVTAGVVVLLFVQVIPAGPAGMNAGAAGFIAGAGAGAAIGLRSLTFDGRGPAWQRGLRFVLGLAVLFLLIGGMRGFGVPEGGLGRLVLALYMAITGLWLTFGAPWLFERVRLSRAPAA